MNTQIENVINALKKNRINGIYAENSQGAVEIIKEMLTDGCVITSGGSVTLQQSGVWDLITQPQYKYLDRNRQGISPQEREEVYRAVIGCDFYFCSSNAITEKGELINVDGFANRVSAISFGPKKVIIVVGKNKIVKDAQQGFLRVKQIAAPKNCVRLNIDTPCSKLGHCVSLERGGTPDITDGCSHERRICTSYSVIGKQQDPNRITVIIVDEELGY